MFTINKVYYKRDYTKSLLYSFCPFFPLLFLPSTGHGMVADRLVDSDSRVIGFPIVWLGLGNVTFLACCAVSHVCVWIEFADVVWV